MSFSYSGDPSSSSTDAIRFYLGDTDPTDPQLQDEEIDFVSTQLVGVYDDDIMTACILARAIASKYAREVSISADGVTIAGEQLQQKYLDLSNSLRQMYSDSNLGGGPIVTGLSPFECPDPTVKPMSFAKGMHDNARAGQQSYPGYPGFIDAENYEEGGYWSG